MWSFVIHRKFVGEVGICAVFFGRCVLLNVVFHVTGEDSVVVFVGFDFGMCC